MAGDGPKGPVIGDLGFKGPPDERGVIDVGYSVVREERGKGYATEAVRALIDWAFGNPVVKTITADCEQANPASAAVLEKIGMKRDGKKGHLLHWKMTKRDWERSRPGGEEARPPRIHFIEEGSGPPAILIHGLACSSVQWMYSVPALAGAGYRAIAVDLPGFGLSPMPRRDVTNVDYSAEIIRFMDEMGIPRAALIGNSMGGFVAWYTAAVAPSRVSAIVLVDPAGAPGPRTHPTVPRFFTSKVLRYMLDLRAARHVAGLFRRRVAELVYGDPSRMTPEVFEALFKAARQARVLFAGRLLLRSLPEEAADLLARVTCPALTLWGTLDKIIPVEKAGFFAAHLPRGESALLEGSGHVPMLEVPQEFIRAVLKFLNSHVPPSR